jgi:putative ABC transport system permease protein
LASIDGKVSFILGVQPAEAFKIFDIKPLSGSPEAMDARSIALYKDAAKRLRVQVGDTVPVTFRDTGKQQLRVAMIYGEKQPAQDYVISIAGYDANFSNRFDTMVFVKRAPGASAAETLAAVNRAAKEYPGVDVLDRAGFEAEQSRPLDQMLALVYALLALAILIALLGISNTLALSVFERTREIGLLRAVGMTRGQLRSAIRWESVIIALQGTALGLMLGVFFGWAFVSASEAMGITVFKLPYATLAAITVLAGLAGMLAALGPSRRAAKLDVLRAVVGE